MSTFLVLMRAEMNEQPALWIVQNCELNDLIRKVGYRFSKCDIFELAPHISPSPVPWGGMQLARRATVQPTDGFAYSLNYMKYFLDEVDSLEQLEKLRKDALVSISTMFAEHKEYIQNNPPVEIINMQEEEKPPQEEKPAEPDEIPPTG